MFSRSAPLAAALGAIALAASLTPSIALSSAAFAVAESGLEPGEAARLGARLVRQVDRCLERRAFVAGVDFSDWPDRVRSLQESSDQTPEETFVAAQSHADVAAAINEVLGSYGVSHLRLLTPGEVAVRDRGQEMGAGLRLIPAENGYVVSQVFPDSPAAAAGLRRGDLVVKVDGRSLVEARSSAEQELPAALPGVVERARLVIPPGGVRRINVWPRGRQNDERALELSAGTYRPSLPLTTERREGVAWLALTSLRSGVYDKEAVREFFQALLDDPPELGLVLDLRSNGGGRLTNFYHLVAHLLPDGAVVNRIIERKRARRTQRQRGSLDLLRDARPQRLSKQSAIPTYEGPLVVLTDRAAGSGGDLLPAVLRDLGRAELIGTRTAGMLLTGVWCELDEGFELVLPSGEILPPSGERIEGVGVWPDIELTALHTASDEIIAAAARRALLRLAAGPAG